jgi:hypothetical protein
MLSLRDLELVEIREALKLGIKIHESRRRIRSRLQQNAPPNCGLSLRRHAARRGPLAGRLAGGIDLALFD